MSRKSTMPYQRMRKLQKWRCRGSPRYTYTHTHTLTYLRWEMGNVSVALDFEMKSSRDRIFGSLIMESQGPVTYKTKKFHEPQAMHWCLVSSKTTGSFVASHSPYPFWNSTLSVWVWLSLHKLTRTSEVSISDSHTPTSKENWDALILQRVELNQPNKLIVT